MYRCKYCKKPIDHEELTLDRGGYIVHLDCYNRRELMGLVSFVVGALIALVVYQYFQLGA